MSETAHPDLNLTPDMATEAEVLPPLNPKRPPRFSTSRLTMIAMMAAVIAIMAQIAIPSTVPVTLQTAAMFCCIIILPPRDALPAICTYILLGAIGLPVFANFKGGFGVLLGPTGGFILGMIFGTYIGGLLLRGRYSLPRAVTACVIADAVCLILGALQFSLVMSTSVKAAFALACLPYIPFDILKLVLFLPLAHKVRSRLQKQYPRNFV